MKIINIKTYITNPGKNEINNSAFGKNLIFIKLETDNGIIGWGECYSQTDRDIQITSHVQKLEPYIIGYDPINIRNFILGTYRDFSNKRPSMDLWCAISGIEIAMWDILGKYYDQPVYNLLGGKLRDRIKVYANGWAKKLDHESLSKNSIEMVKDRGFKALKFDPFSGPWEEWPEDEIIEEAVERIKVVRESVGIKVDL